MQSYKTISDAARSVLETADAAAKAKQARKVALRWFAGDLDWEFSVCPNARPARPDRPELLPPAKMPKRRKGGTLANRLALIHAVAHIELNAIDLAFDIVARFGDQMPREFTNDWVKVGDDEARHFMMLSRRLQDLDSYYGALPAHDGLWESSQATADNIAARLAVVPMVLEARGLDVTPDMISKLVSAGDTETAEVLKVIYEEEVSHVAAGKRWFAFIAQKTGREEEPYFQELVQSYFRGFLKPPFNKPARDQAGMPASFYEPLVNLL